MACKVSNNLPRDVWFNRYVTEGAEAEFAAVGTYPNLKMVSYTVACQHCKNPACVAVCPTGASIQDDDGIVRVLEDKCIGCKSCIQACPYDVRTLIEKPEYYVDDVQLGRRTEIPCTDGVVAKCTFCKDLIVQGKNPACMDLCPARARFWGDLDDPNSDVSKLIASRDDDVLREDAGTEPRVFYLK